LINSYQLTAVSRIVCTSVRRVNCRWIRHEAIHRNSLLVVWHGGLLARNRPTQFINFWFYEAIFCQTIGETLLRAAAIFFTVNLLERQSVSRNCLWVQTKEGSRILLYESFHGFRRMLSKSLMPYIIRVGVVRSPAALIGGSPYRASALLVALAEDLPTQLS